MATMQNLTIRIGADASGAMSVINQATQQVNNFGYMSNAAATGMNNLNAATRTTEAGIVLTGRSARESVSNLGQLSSQANIVTTSMHSMTAAMGASAQSSARWVQELNNSTRAAQQAANANEQLHRSNTAVSGSFGSLNSVLGAFGITVGAVGLAQLAKDILKTNIEMEQLRARLDAASSSLASSKTAFAMILQIAKETPQSISEITKAYTMMKNFGLDPNEKAMRGFTDVTSKLGGASDTLTGIIRAFGQANGKAALHAQDANQMIERGVPVYGLLVRVLDKSTAEIMKMMEAGELGRDTMEKLRQELFKWADGSSAKMMDTLGGSIEGFSSSWKHLEDTLMGSKTESLLKNSVQFMGAYLDWLSVKMADSPIDQKITELQNKLVDSVVNPKKSFISIGLQSLGVIDTPASIHAQINALQKEKLDSEKALAADKKQIQDQANGERIQAEMATNKAIENGDMDALKKYMSAKLEAIKSTDKEIIRQQAELASIPAKLAMAIVSVESTGQMVVNKDSGAAGLMQVMPANYQKQGYTQAQMLSDASISVKAGLKVWQDSMDVAKKAVVQGTIDAGQIFDYAATLYTTKHQTISDRIKKNGGVFDINLFKEASDWAGKVKAGMSLQNVSENDIFAPYKKSANEAAQATKKFATEQEQVAKKIADNDRQLTESTAFGKYNATIDGLTEAHKRYIDTQGKSGISQATYSQGIENANETLLKNTDYVVANAKALEEQAKARDKYLGHIGDYNATTDELTRNKQRGAITQGEYGLGVAQANAGLMNQVANAYPDAKIPNIPVERVGEVIDAKNATESEKLLNAQLEKSKSLLDGMKTSGANAFDGLLGGISAVTSAFTGMSDSLSEISTKQDQNLKNYTDYLNSAGTTQEGITKSTENYYKTKDTLSDESRAIEMRGIRQVAGASSKMFSEQSAGRKIMHTLEMTFGAIEMAMSAKKIVMNGIEAVTNQGKGDPYSAFPRIAAMAAIMAALGVGIAGAVGGGSSTSYSGTYASREATKSTGTVLGDAEANSQSVKNIVTTLNDIHASEYPELKGINDSFKELGRTIVSFVTGVAKATSSFTNMSFGVEQLQEPKNTMANIPFIGSLFTKTTITKIGEGMIIEAFNPLIEGMELGIKSYSTFEIKRKSLFGTKTTIQEIYGDIPQALNDELTKLFGYMGKSVMSSLASMDIIKYLGVSLPNFSIGTQKWDWFKADNKQEYFNNMINATADRIAAVSQHIIGDFQKLGEGLFETVNRMAIQQGVVMNKYKKFGIEFESLTTTLSDGTKIGSLGMATLSDSLVQMYNSSADAKDGLKNFISVMDEVYKILKTKGQQTQDSIASTRDYLVNQGADAKKLFDDTYVREFLTQKQTQLMSKEQELAAAKEKVASLGDYYGNAYKPDSGYDLTKLAPIFTKILGASNYSSATWDMVGNGWTEASIKAMKGVNALWDDLNASLDKSTTLKAQGMEGITAAGMPYQNIDEFNAAKKVAQDAVVSISKDIGNLNTAIIESDKLLNKTIPSFAKMQDSYLDIVQTESEKTARKHADIIKSDFAGLTDDLSGMDYLQPIITAMRKAGYAAVITAVDIQKFIWKTEDAAKAIQKLTESTKYVKDLKTTIGDWVTNLQVTSLGSTKSQLDAAAKNFSAKMSVINNDFMTAEQKRTALSGITGNADQYIQAIRNFYGSGKEGVDKIQAVVDQVSTLPEQLDVQQLQLNALDAIKTSVEGVGLDVGNVLQPSLNALQAQYKTANAMDAGVLKDSMLSVLDTYGTGILNAFYSGDTNRQNAAAQVVNTNLGATGAISKSGNLADEEKTAALTALNQATVSAGKFVSAYALMPNDGNLTLMRKAVTDFTNLISESVSNISDKNFSTVLVGALNGLSSALSGSTLSLDVMGGLTKGMNNAVGAWSSAAKVGQKESDTLTSGVVSYGAYLGKVASDYTIDDAKKEKIYTSFSDASLKLFTNVSSNVGKEEMKSYTQDFVSVLIGKGSAGKASGIGAMGLVTGLSALLGSSAITSEQKKPFIDKLLTGTEAFVDGYQKTIGVAGILADTSNAKLSLVTGFEKYISDASGLLTTSNVTDITVGITTLNGALNAVITEAARKISEASGIAMAQEAANQANYNVYAGSNADVTGISPVINFDRSLSTSDAMSSNNQNYATVNQEVTKTFKDVYGASELAKNIAAKDLVKLADFAGISADSVTRVTQIGNSLKVYGANGYSVQGDALPLFAKGGIANSPSIFGEAGAEAAVPLPDGRTIPVTLSRQAANDSSNEAAEEVRQLRVELKSALERLERLTVAGNDIVLNGFTLTQEESKKQTRHLDEIKDKSLKRGFG